MRKIKLDCPICGVFMRPVGKSPVRGVPSRFICPVCNSMFSPYLGEDKRKYIQEELRKARG